MLASDYPKRFSKQYHLFYMYTVVMFETKIKFDTMLYLSGLRWNSNIAIESLTSVWLILLYRKYSKHRISYFPTIFFLNHLQLNSIVVYLILFSSLNVCLNYLSSDKFSLFSYYTYISLNDLRIMLKGRSGDIIIHQKEYKSLSLLLFFPQVIFFGFSTVFVERKLLNYKNEKYEEKTK